MKLMNWVAAATLALSTPLQAEELKLAHFMSPNHPFHSMIFEWWGEKLSEASAGDVTVRVFPAGELGAGPLEQYARAVDGVADVSFIIQGYTPGDIFPKNLVAELPGVVGDQNDPTAAMNAAQDMFADEFRRVKLLGTWAMPQAVLFSDTPVDSLDDVAGMKIRVGDKLAGQLVEAWGATAVFMPATEVYTAVQTGVVDAVLINAAAANGFKLIEVTDYLTTGFSATPPIFGLVMNRDAYGDLSDAQKAAIDAVSGEMLETRAGEIGQRITDGSFAAFANAEGKTVIELNPEAVAAFNAGAETVRQARLQELEEKGVDVQSILAAMSGN